MNRRFLRGAVFYEKVTLCEHGEVERHRFLIDVGSHGATRTDACVGATRVSINTLSLWWELWRDRNKKKMPVMLGRRL